MWSAMRTVFFLAMAPLGLMATELYPAGHQTPNVQHTATVGEAQHRRLRRGGCKDGQGRGGGRGQGKGRGQGQGRGRGNRDSSTSPGMESLLELHNKARCLHNAEPLTYNDQMAALAKAQARLLASSCGETDHSESEQSNGYGENLFVCASTGTETCYTPEEAMASLYGNETQADSVAEYGEQATQILWKSTTEMGCALAKCDNDAEAYVYLVCLYNPVAENMELLEEEVDLPSGDSC